MSYLTESQILNFSKDSSLTESSRYFIKSSSLDVNTTIFLSHSHFDRELAKNMKIYLSKYRINLYIDWLDNKMPANTNAKTALELKNKIKSNNYFLLLATNNALASKWVPWELGIADGAKSYDNILILPINDNYGRFNGNEYLQIYKRVEQDNLGELGIFEPNKHNGILLESVLRR